MEGLYGLWNGLQEMPCSSGCFDECISGRKKSIIIGALIGRHRLLIYNILGNVLG